MLGVGAARTVGNWAVPEVGFGSATKVADSFLRLLKPMLGSRKSKPHPSPIAGRTTAVFVGNNRLLVGTNVGLQAYAFYLEADDRLLTPWFALTGRYEDDVTAFLLRTLKPDSHCIDVGTNFGYFLCLMARTCPAGHVLGVEPDPELAAIAQDNLCLNGVHDRATIIRGAVADRVGELTLHRREYRSGNTSVIPVDASYTDYLGEPPAQPFTVASHSIDTLADRLAGPVDLIKIDVEGAEPLALAGAVKTISRNPDLVIVMEWSPGQIAAAGFSIADFVDSIGALGLRCSRLVHGTERSLPLSELPALPYQSAIILRRISA